MSFGKGETWGFVSAKLSLLRVAFGNIFLSDRNYLVKFLIIQDRKSIYKKIDIILLLWDS